MARFNLVSLQLKNKTILSIRCITIQDAPSYYDFRDQIAVDSTNTLQYTGRTRLTLDELQASFSNDELNKSTLNIGAFDGQKLIGQLKFWMTHPDHPWLQHVGQFGLMILKDYWGLGIGKELLAIQDDFARSIYVTSRWREMSESEFRMPPTCPERREGSSQIRGLAPRSIRAYALLDTSLALSRQRPRLWPF